MSKSYLLINEPPLTVSPTLATIIGLDEAILIQQVHYWLMNPKNAGRTEEGEKWVYNTYEEWQESNFPFWSVDKVQRLFLKLEKQGLIISRQFDAKNRDMRKFYRLAYDEICMLHDSFLQPSIDAKLHDVNGTETTTENTNNLKTDEVQGSYKPAKHKLQGVEWAIASSRTVTESDLQNPQERAALEAFERDLQCPASWTWYPAKSSDEPAWKALREFVVSLYKSDPGAFGKYYTWARDPFARGAKLPIHIRQDPACFEYAWQAYQAANPETAPIQTPNEGKGFYG